MSNTVHGGVDHTVTRGNVEVTRHLEADGRGIVGTVELASRASEPKLVEVSQSIPTDISVESTAFKPDAAPEFKDFSGDRITFRQTVEDEPVRVVFGIMAAEPVEQLGFAPPAIEAADPVGATRSAPAGDEDGDIEIDADLDLDDGGGADSDAASGGAADDQDDSDAPGSPLDPGALVGAADGGTAAADASLEQGRRSVDLRLDRLSARIEEFATYAEALESFIDERGTAPEFVDRVEARVDEIDERVATTRDEFDAEFDDLRGDLEATRAETDDLRGEFDAELDDLRGDLDQEVSAVRAETTAEFDDLRDEFGTELDDLRGELEATRAEMGGLRDDVAALRTELETLSAEVETLTGMRESLASALSEGPLAEPTDPTTGAEEGDDGDDGDE